MGCIIPLLGYGFRCYLQRRPRHGAGGLSAVASIAPAKGVGAGRSGSSVNISWSAAAPAVELAYFIEARICSGGFPVDVFYTTTSTSISLTDETSCGPDSYGQVRVQNKLGYSTAVSIPWP